MGKDTRIIIILECTCCARKGVNKTLSGISRYITQKNRHNTPNRLEFRKKISLLSKVYNSLGNKEIDVTECLCYFYK